MYYTIVFNANICKINRLHFKGVNVGDIGLLSQHIITNMELLQQQLKLVKRRLPPDNNISNLGLNKEISENLYQCCQHASKIMKTLQDIVKTSTQAIIATGGILNASLFLFFSPLLIY